MSKLSQGSNHKKKGYVLNFGGTSMNYVLSPRSTQSYILCSCWVGLICTETWKIPTWQRLKSFSHKIKEKNWQLFFFCHLVTNNVASQHWETLNHLRKIFQLFFWQHPLAFSGYLKRLLFLLKHIVTVQSPSVNAADHRASSGRGVLPTVLIGTDTRELSLFQLNISLSN